MAPAKKQAAAARRGAGAKRAKTAHSAATKRATKAPAKRAAAKKAPAGRGRVPKAAPRTKKAPSAAARKGTKAVKKAPAKKAPASRARPAKAPAKKAPPPAKKAPPPAKKAPPPAKKAPSRKLGAARAPAPVRPTRGPYASDARFLEEQRALLLEERGVYQRQAEDLRAEAESLALDREPGDVQFDEESGEGGTVTVDRERDLALSAQARAAVEEIDEALAKIDNGRYGICEGCGELIAKARLEALPYAKLCIGCKSGGLSRR